MVTLTAFIESPLSLSLMRSHEETTFTLGKCRILLQVHLLSLLELCWYIEGLSGFLEELQNARKGSRQTVKPWMKILSILIQQGIHSLHSDSISMPTVNTRLAFTSLSPTSLMLLQISFVLYAKNSSAILSPSRMPISYSFAFIVETSLLWCLIISDMIAP